MDTENQIIWVKPISNAELQPRNDLEGMWKRWVEPVDGNRGMIWGKGELQPGQSAGWHAHPEPELFYVLEGEGKAYWKKNDGIESADLVPRTAFFKHGGIEHRMECTGSSPLRGLFFKIGAPDR